MMERRFMERICATCEYWENERTLHFQNNQLYAVMHSPRQGHCLAQNNVLMTGFVNACPAYKRWHKLPQFDYLNNRKSTEQRRGEIRAV